MSYQFTKDWVPVPCTSKTECNMPNSMCKFPHCAYGTGEKASKPINPCGETLMADLGKTTINVSDPYDRIVQIIHGDSRIYVLTQSGRLYMEYAGGWREKTYPPGCEPPR